MHDENGLRVRNGDVSGGACVVEMDVRDEDVVDALAA
jgi:hypothetical protein